MAIIQVDNGMGNFGQDMGNLAQSLSRIIFPGTVKDMEIEQIAKTNPQIGATWAAAVHQNGDQALAAIGGSPRMAALLKQMYPMTEEQKVAYSLAGDDAHIQNRVAAAKQAPTVQLAQGDAAIATAGTAPAVARATIAEADYKADEIKYLRDEDIPRLRAMIQGKQFDLAAQEMAGVERLGLVERRLLSEVTGLDLSQRQNKFQMDNLDSYHEFAKSLPPHLRGIAIAGMVNPNLVGHITQHEQNAFEQNMLTLRTNAAQSVEPAISFMDAWKVQGDLRERINDGLDRLRAANEKGDENARKAAVADLQNLSQTNRGLIEQGILQPGNVISAEMRDRMIKSGVGAEFVEEPQFDPSWVAKGMDRFKQMQTAGVIPADANPVDYLRQSPGWNFMSREEQAKTIAAVSSGQVPNLTRTAPNGTSANVQGAAAPQPKPANVISRQTAAMLDVDYMPSQIRLEAKRVLAGPRNPVRLEKLINDTLAEGERARTQLASYTPEQLAKLTPPQQKKIDNLRVAVRRADQIKAATGAK